MPLLPVRLKSFCMIEFKLYLPHAKWREMGCPGVHEPIGRGGSNSGWLQYPGPCTGIISTVKNSPPGMAIPVSPRDPGSMGETLAIPRIQRHSIG